MIHGNKLAAITVVLTLATGGGVAWACGGGGSRSGSQDPGAFGQTGCTGQTGTTGATGDFDNDGDFDGRDFHCRTGQTGATGQTGTTGSTFAGRHHRRHHHRHSRREARRFSRRR